MANLVVVNVGFNVGFKNFLFITLNIGVSKVANGVSRSKSVKKNKNKN